MMPAEKGAAAAGQQPVVHSELPKRSFAEVLSNSKAVPFEDKAFSSVAAAIGVERSTHKGEPAVAFSQLAVEKIAEPFKFALVGKFSRGRPAMEEVRKFFKTLDLLGGFSIGLLDKRHVLIQLEVEADFYRVWKRGIWYVLKFPMRVFKWTYNFHVDRESSIVPVWFSLHKLPIHLFPKECLFPIVACLGTPLYVDTATAKGIRPSVARVCVEVDLTADLPSRVWIQLGASFGFWQVLEPENLPSYCLFCFRQGHDHHECHLKHPHLIVKNTKQSESHLEYRQKTKENPKPQAQEDDLHDVTHISGMDQADPTQLQQPSPEAATPVTASRPGCTIKDSQQDVLPVKILSVAPPTGKEVKRCEDLPPKGRSQPHAPSDVAPIHDNTVHNQTVEEQPLPLAANNDDSTDTLSSHPTVKDGKHEIRNQPPLSGEGMAATAGGEQPPNGENIEKYNSVSGCIPMEIIFSTLKDNLSINEHHAKENTPILQANSVDVPLDKPILVDEGSQQLQHLSPADLVVQKDLKDDHQVEITNIEISLHGASQMDGNLLDKSTGSDSALVPKRQGHLNSAQLLFQKNMRRIRRSHGKELRDIFIGPDSESEQEIEDEDEHCWALEEKLATPPPGKAKEKKRRGRPKKKK